MGIRKRKKVILQTSPSWAMPGMRVECEPQRALLAILSVSSLFFMA